VNLVSGTYTSSLSLTGGTQSGVSDVLAAASGATSINISAGSVTGFEVLDLSASTAAYNVTMTPTQLAQFTGTNVINGTDDIVTLSTAGTVTGQPVLLNYVLADGTGNVFNASTTALNVSVTGGNSATTYNFGATLTAADTITGTAGSDTLVITGAATGSATVTAIETIKVNYATAATFTTGAIAPGAASSIDLSGSSAAVTLDAALYVPTTSLTITDGPGADIITLSSTEAIVGVTTVSLAGGGADRVVYVDSATNPDSFGFTINAFTTGSGANADQLKITLTTTAPETHAFVGDYAIVSAAGGSLTVVNSATALQVVEINQVAGLATSLTDISDGGAVETAIAAAVGTVTMAGGVATRSALVVLYGTGAASGDAGLYNVVFTDGQDAITTNMTVDLIGIIKSVTADSFVSSNFA
jgi:hypothetical protein